MRDSRSAANARDKERHVWVSESDGVNRASIRKEMAQAPRAVRLFKRAQMEHQQSIAAMKQHALANELPDLILNQRKAKRRARR